MKAANLQLSRIKARLLKPQVQGNAPTLTMAISMTMTICLFTDQQTYRHFSSQVALPSTKDGAEKEEEREKDGKLR